MSKCQLHTYFSHLQNSHRRQWWSVVSQANHIAWNLRVASNWPRKSQGHYPGGDPREIRKWTGKINGCWTLVLAVIHGMGTGSSWCVLFCGENLRKTRLDLRNNTSFVCWNWGRVWRHLGKWTVFLYDDCQGRRVSELGMDSWIAKRDSQIGWKRKGAYVVLSGSIPCAHRKES